MANRRPITNVSFGSLADLLPKFSLMSASGRKAAIRMGVKLTLSGRSSMRYRRQASLCCSLNHARDSLLQRRTLNISVYARVMLCGGSDARMPEL